MLIQALHPLKIRLPDGIHVLHPGQSYELAELHALKLLAKAADKVRRAEPTEAKKRPKEEPGKEEPANSIKVGSCLWYRLPGKPEVGPCQVTSLNDLGWHMVQIVENGDLAWIHQDLITRVQPAIEGKE